jgi:hypothetical protein
MPHSRGCKGTKVRISSAARIPKRNASKRTWDVFYAKFVSRLHSKKYNKNI